MSRITGKCDDPKSRCICRILPASSSIINDGSRYSSSHHIPSHVVSHVILTPANGLKLLSTDYGIRISSNMTTDQMDQIYNDAKVNGRIIRTLGECFFFVSFDLEESYTCLSTHSSFP
jgi:hypothetical protein